MIKAFLKGLENSERPLLGPNYWVLDKMCLFLPKSKLGKAAYIFLHELVTLFVVTQFMELYVVRTDIQEVLTNLATSIVSIICVIKSNTFLMWQESWIKLIDYVTEADKFERNDKDLGKGKIIDKYTKYCRRINYFYWTLVFMTIAIVAATPVIRIYTSSSYFHGEHRNETEPFPHIVSSWMPMDKNHSPGIWITIAWQIFMCAYGSGILAAYDTNVIVIMVFFSGKLELLRERCKQIMGSVGKRISEDEAKRVIRQMHNIHKLLNENSRLFNSLLSPVMFVYVVLYSVMLCANAFIISSVKNAIQMLQMGEYLFFGVAQLFMFCWHSNDVLLKSQKVSLGPYESEWWAASVRQRKSLLILSGQLRINHIFTAGPFTNLTLYTFITILKGAYSYYTLLRD